MKAQIDPDHAVAVRTWPKRAIAIVVQLIVILLIMGAYVVLVTRGRVLTGGSL